MNPDKIQSFEEFLAATSVQIPLADFVINLLLVAILSMLISHIYTRYGNALSNRRFFSRNFLLIGMTTMLIITIVKSSLALSLGLVGALSIVRFRAAIKEPEELAYLFLVIGVGLGLGADQRVITVLAFLIISSVILVRKKLVKANEENQNLHLTVYSHNPEKIKLEDVIETLNKYCMGVQLKRFDETKEVLEATFQVEFSDFEQLRNTKDALQDLSDNVKITFLDNNGII